MLNGKTILVAGAAGFLGRTLCQALLDNGASVVAADIETQNLKLTFSDSTGLLPGISLYQVDFNVPSQVESLFERYPQLTGAVNCTYPRHPSYGRHFFDVTLDSFNENVQAHLGVAFLFAQQSAKHFKVNQQPFSLVNLSSIYGVVAPDFDIYQQTTMTMPVEYAAIKSAIIQLSRYVTSYIGNSDFRVNVVSPGGLFDHQPANFLDKYKARTLGHGMLDPMDICGAIMFLLSDQSKYMQGQNLIVDDGFTL